MRANETEAMSADPILSAVDGYRGSIVDLDRDMVIRPAMFAHGWQSLARRMGEGGLHRGDRVIVAVGNGPQFIAIWAAILAQGGSPLLVHGETPVAELRRIARRFRVRFIATDGAPEAELQAVAKSVQTLCGDSWTRMMWAVLDDRSGLGREPFLQLPGVPLHPTSGTTGEPKLAIRPAACAVAEAKHYVETIGVGCRDRILAMAPMCHAYGYGWYVVTPMVTGADVLTMRRFKSTLVFQRYKEQNITLVPAVAAMLATLTFGAGDRLHAPQRRVITGGAPLPERTAANFERISGVRVRPLYGTTEAGAIAVARPGDPLSRRGRIGLPFDGVEVEIRHADDLQQLAEVYGLVYVRSASLMTGYLKDEKLDTSVLADGWFNTGDLGWIDAEGALHLSGRQAEVINVSGMKVVPSDVEEVITSFPGVVDVKVYSGRTRHGSPYVKAAVVADEGVDIDQIRSHCEKQLVYYERPSQIILVDSLPRSPRGKILMDKLP
jgi:acyl-CoA synthetase (AMP-forming)/AMP-acid ligase II